MNEERPEAADVSTEMPSLEQLREVPRKNTPSLLGVVVGRFWSYFLSGCGAVLRGQVALKPLFSRAVCTAAWNASEAVDVDVGQLDGRRLKNCPVVVGGRFVA